MEGLKRYYCVKFSRKSGKIDVVLNGLGHAMLQMWALRNTTAKTKDTMIFDEDGMMFAYFEGTGDWPKITKYGAGTEEGEVNVDRFCPGLLEALLEEEA